VVGWCAANQNRFWGRHETDRDDNARVPMRGWAGAWDGREDWTTISLLPHVLREILEPQGFHVDEVLDRWAERGWIKMAVREMANKTVKNRTTVVRINGAPMRVYQFGREAVESHVADDEVLRGEAD